MLPAINLKPDNTNSAPLLFGTASVVIGVHVRFPSVLNQDAILTAEELERAVAQAQSSMPKGDAVAKIALVADVEPSFFQALTIHTSNGQLRLYDTTYNSNTLHLISHKPLIKNADLVYTWDGVLGIGRLWFEIEMRADVASAESVSLETRSGLDTRIATSALG
jgi:hypothetical protein